MRGLDTNVLLRYLTDDDPLQSPIARALLVSAQEQDECFFVSSVLLCELVWTLRGKPYSLDRPALADVVERILAARLFEVQDREVIHRALADFRQGPADFADYLIGHYGRQAGCADIVTFDRDLEAAEGFSLLRPT
jgi:predicted nucleic-acid-binding protein